MKIQQRKANGFVFECRVHGDPEHEMLLLLHGFPETSAMWVPLMKRISELGYFCVAPNLRGYSSGARPRGKKHYTLDKLCKDVFEIAVAFGKKSYHLAGHDWGAVIGWRMVHDNPEPIQSWTSLSVPHIHAFWHAISTDKEQQKKSRYIKMFQWPVLPEFRIRKNNFQVFKKLWRNSSADEVTDYLTVFRSKGSLTAALNYYRANFKSESGFRIGKITVPTLFIWGNKDMAIGKDSVNRNHFYMPDNYKFIELDTGHWLVQTAFDDVCNALESHIKSSPK